MTLNNENSDLITRRLGQALEGEASRNPLPSDFAVTLVDGLRDRPRPSWVSLLAVPMLAGAVVVAVVAAAILISLPRSGVSGPGSSGSLSTHTPDLSHYSADDISFDYPADWRIIEQGINTRHYQWIPVVLGTGEWMLNCQPVQPSGDIVSGITCGRDIFTVAAGEVVVEMYTWWGPPGLIATPPPTAVVLPTGWWATVSDTADASIWQIYVPGWPQPLTVEARFADPGVEGMRAAVKSLVEGLAVSPTPVAPSASADLPASAQ